MKKILTLFAIIILCGSLSYAEGTNPQGEDRAERDTTVSVKEDSASMSQTRVTADEAKSGINFQLEDYCIILGVVVLLLIAMVVYHLIINNRNLFRNRLIDELKNNQEGDPLYCSLKRLVEKVTQKRIEDVLRNASTSYQPARTDIDINKIVEAVILKQKEEKIEKEPAQIEKVEASIESSEPESDPVQLLYADSIYKGEFHRVKESPDDDTVFELRLTNPNDTQANFTIYKQAHNRILANLSFLEGCEKQVLGKTKVSVEKEGVAQKDSNGRWNIVTSLEVNIS